MTEDVSSESGDRFQICTSASFVLYECQFCSPVVHNVEADQPSCQNVCVCWTPATHEDLNLSEKSEAALERKDSIPQILNHRKAEPQELRAFVHDCLPTFRPGPQLENLHPSHLPLLF